MELEEVILALKAAGWNAPEYEILPDGSYHFFHGNKETNSLLHTLQSGRSDQEHQDRG